LLHELVFLLQLLALLDPVEQAEDVPLHEAHLQEGHPEVEDPVFPDLGLLNEVFVEERGDVDQVVEQEDRDLQRHEELEGRLAEAVHVEVKEADRQPSELHHAEPIVVHVEEDEVVESAHPTHQESPPVRSVAEIDD